MDELFSSLIGTRHERVAPSVTIGNSRIAPGEPAYVIAEIGINHNGDIDLAKRLISVAVAAGCDAVKSTATEPGALRERKQKGLSEH
jgi:sialic acid synthase SpsE